MAYHYQPMPFDFIVRVGFDCAVIASPFAWALQNWKTVAVRAWVSFAFNAVRKLTVYRA